MGEDNCCKQKEVREITCDQEAWLKNRLVTLVNICDRIKTCQSVSADECAVEKAQQGAIEGTALEILYMLNLEPSYVNLPKRSWWVKDNTGDVSRKTYSHPAGCTD